MTVNLLVCAPGWTSENCGIPCPDGFYGPNCSQLCKCRNNTSCRKNDGLCNCEPGYMGTRCEDGEYFVMFYWPILISKFHAWTQLYLSHFKILFNPFSLPWRILWISLHVHLCLRIFQLRMSSSVGLCLPRRIPWYQMWTISARKSIWRGSRK